MLDSVMRPLIEPSLNKAADQIAKYNIHPNIISLTGLVIGLVGCFAIAIQAYMPALLLLIANRVLDGLDGAVARQRGETDFGGFLDIICDLIFYSAFVFFFALGHPHHILAATFLLFSYVGTGCSFLAYAVIAAKKGMSTDINGNKSFFHAAGLAEGTETFLFMIFVCLMPGYFTFFAFIFGIMCWVTTIGRCFEAWRAFSPIEQNYDDADNIR